MPTENARRAEESARLEPGRTIEGRYRVVCRIGRGGMGSVYELTHVRLDRQFAAKVLSHELSDDRTVLARFRREAEIVAGLRHPNIVDIVDWAELEDGRPCIIMEYLHGESLSRRIERSAPMSWAEIREIGYQVLSALAVTHREQIVHRDLKPENIFVARTDADQEVIKLLDFGVSKIHASSTLQTQKEAFLGTPSYMSPEQANGDAALVDHTADLWAMGAILYEMATGARPFHGNTIPSLLYQVCYKDPAPLTDTRPDAPPGFVHLVARAMSRERAGRWTSADEMRDALDMALGGGPAYLDSGSPVAYMRPDDSAPFIPSMDGVARPAFPRTRSDLGLPGSAPGHVPAHGDSHGGAHASGSMPGIAETPRSRRTGLIVLLAVLFLGVGLGLGLMLASSDSPETASEHPVSDPAENTSASPAEDTSTQPSMEQADESAGQDLTAAGASPEVASPDAGVDDASQASADQAISDQAGDQAGTDQDSQKTDAEERRAAAKAKERARARAKARARALERERKRKKREEEKRKKGEPVNPFGATP